MQPVYQQMVLFSTPHNHHPKLTKICLVDLSILIHGRVHFQKARDLYPRTQVLVNDYPLDVSSGKNSDSGRDSDGFPNTLIHINHFWGVVMGAWRPSLLWGIGKQSRPRSGAAELCRRKLRRLIRVFTVC